MSSRNVGRSRYHTVAQLTHEASKSQEKERRSNPDWLSIVPLENAPSLKYGREEFKSVTDELSSYSDTRIGTPTVNSARALCLAYPNRF